MQLGRGILKMPTDVLEKVCVKITAYDKLIVVHETIPVRVLTLK